MLIIFIRSALIYILLTFCMRLMGKRTLGELQPSEMVTTILISNIATLPMEDTTLPLIFGIVPILVFVGFEMICSNLSLRLPKFRKFLIGSPITIIEHGQLNQKNLARMRCTIDDLYVSMRQAGYFDITEIQCAVAETTGNISFLPKSGKTPIPLLLISDGRLIKTTMQQLHLNSKWLHDTLKAQHLTVKTTFLMTVDKNLNCHIVPKEKL